MTNESWAGPSIPAGKSRVFSRRRRGNLIPDRATGLLHLVATALCMSLLFACETAPGIDKQFGTYFETVPAPPRAVADAAIGALRDMGLQIISDKPTLFGNQIVARNAFNTKIIITTGSAGPESTKLGVKVDPGESEGLSLSVLTKIKSNL